MATADTGLRSRALTAFLEPYWSRGLERVAGADEAGRGPLAGPVVAAAVILERGVAIRGLDDSKRLSAAQRELVYAEIAARARAIGIGAASVGEIERINILQATGLAMRRALDRLGGVVELVLVDGSYRFDLGVPVETVVGGDGRCAAIAAASVVAKVTRDRLMQRLHERYPLYGFLTNKGYSTAEHRAALNYHGPCPHHRLSFLSRQLELFGDEVG
ncbi:MAG: ribonuclease HII [Bacillota bacterium]